MFKKNLMSILVAAVATGAVLVGYNAFLRGDTSEGNRATSKLSSYLSLDKTKQESKSDEDNVAGTDNAETTAPATTQPTDTAPNDTASSAGTAQSTPATTSTTGTTPAVAKSESTYTAKEGDTYGCIAEKYYGSFEHYVDVMGANPVSQQGFTEYGLFVGAKLKLPAIAKENLKPASSLCQ